MEAIIIFAFGLKQNLTIKFMQGIYRHFKGDLYKVLYIAKHSESLDLYVVYQPVHENNAIWVRPYKMFFEEVRYKQKIVKRFEFVRNE